jgi:hypothetical protein
LKEQEKLYQCYAGKDNKRGFRDYLKIVIIALHTIRKASQSLKQFVFYKSFDLQNQGINNLVRPLARASTGLLPSDKWSDCWHEIEDSTETISKIISLQTKGICYEQW